MGCPVPVHCRHCNEPLDVYLPFEERFCSEDCADAYLDPRDPDPSRSGIFRDHNCWKCRNGALPCVNPHPGRCDYPHARND